MWPVLIEASCLGIPLFAICDERDEEINERKKWFRKKNAFHGKTETQEITGIHGIHGEPQKNTYFCSVVYVNRKTTELSTEIGDGAPDHDTDKFSVKCVFIIMIAHAR